MTTRNPKQKQPAASRVRYEASHPVVSARVSREQYEQLTELKNVHGVNLGDVNDYALDTVKPDLDGAYEDGFEDGYDEARREYEVKFRCGRCGELHVSITTDQGKEAAAQFMYEQGWYGSA